MSKNLSKKDFILAYVNCVRHYINSFLRYKKRYRNYISVAYRVIENRYPVQAIIRDGSSKQFFSPNEIWLDLANIDYNLKENVVYLNGIQLNGGTTNGDIFNIFFSRDYDILPVADKVIIDIGANIADSSIYFASRGAKKIYAAEPNHEVYLIAKQNITTSKFSNQIEIIWAGCSSKTSEKNNPPFLSLDDLIRRYDITPEILKMDCEGCEYDVILNCPDKLLGSFTHILIEYHQGYRNIKEKLERCGFQVKVSMPRYCKKVNTFANNLNNKFSNISTTSCGNSYVGLIFAEK